MLINKKNKYVQKRSDVPNGNWLDDDWYVVNDNSDIARKIIKLYPRFKFVFDEFDEIIDVEEIPKTLEEINKEKVEEIDVELQSIDNQGLNRFLEDIIEYTGIYVLLPSKTKDLIQKKKALREERKKYVEEVEDDGSGIELE